MSLSGRRSGIVHVRHRVMPLANALAARRLGAVRDRSAPVHRRRHGRHPAHAGRQSDRRVLAVRRARARLAAVPGRSRRALGRARVRGRVLRHRRRRRAHRSRHRPHPRLRGGEPRRARRRPSPAPPAGPIARPARASRGRPHGACLADRAGARRPPRRRRDRIPAPRRADLVRRARARGGARRPDRDRHPARARRRIVPARRPARGATPRARARRDARGRVRAEPLRAPVPAVRAARPHHRDTRTGCGDQRGARARMRRLHRDDRRYRAVLAEPRGQTGRTYPACPVRRARDTRHAAGGRRDPARPRPRRDRPRPRERAPDRERGAISAARRQRARRGVADRRRRLAILPVALGARGLRRAGRAADPAGRSLARLPARSHGGRRDPRAPAGRVRHRRGRDVPRRAARRHPGVAWRSAGTRCRTTRMVRPAS